MLSFCQPALQKQNPCQSCFPRHPHSPYRSHIRGKNRFHDDTEYRSPLMMLHGMPAATVGTGMTHIHYGRSLQSDYNESAHHEINKISNYTSFFSLAAAAGMARNGSLLLLLLLVLRERTNEHQANLPTLRRAKSAILPRIWSRF